MTRSLMHRISFVALLLPLWGCIDMNSPTAPAEELLAPPLPLPESPPPDFHMEIGDMLLPHPDYPPSSLMKASEGPAQAPARRFPMVLVHPRGEAPGQRGAPVVDNLADALDRVASGGTIRIFDGEYEVAATVVIDRPVTLEPMGGASPVIRNLPGATHAFQVEEVTDGTVTFRGITFQNVEDHSSVAAILGSRVLVTGSTFDAGAGTAGAFAASGARLTIEGGSFAGGLVGVFASNAGTELVIRNSTFGNHGLASFQHQLGASGQVDNVTALDCAARCAGILGGGEVEVANSRFSIPLVPGPTRTPTAAHALAITAGSKATVSRNDFDGCGFHACIYVGTGTTGLIRDNTFHAAVPKQNEGAGLEGGENWPVVIRFEFQDAGGVVAGNRIDGCSDHACVSLTSGAVVEISDNFLIADPARSTFFGVETWSPDEGPLNEVIIADNEIRNVNQGIGLNHAASEVSGNTISAVTRGIQTYRSTLTARENRIDAMDQGISIGGGTDADLVANTIDPCGEFSCISVNADGAEERITIRENTLRSILARRTFFGIVTVWPAGSGELLITGNRIEGIGAPGNPENRESWPLQIAFQGSAWWPPGVEGVPLGAPQIFSDNVIVNAEVGVRAFHGGVVEGRDNTFTTIFGEVLGAHDRGINRLQFNDVIGYRHALSISGSPVEPVAHRGTLEVTCNWWGDADGPASAEPPPTYTPWATAPVAGTGASGC